ncbi:DNA polymerase III subunit delta' [Niallia sp. XMNu-256]|uniref:DNA polymerase III subunit delta' n=1 Tax=Niallia sp. XMNu-256 TaxID=3082444 RepID=UPI0030D6192E
MVNTWEEIQKIQPVVLKMIKNSLETKRIAHAYLFEGMRGTGKREMAMLLAKGLFCLSPQDEVIPCENCINCKRINHGNHPDIHIVEPDGLSIKKQQIGELQKEFSKTGLETNQKLYMIYHADRMTVNAANSLLKFLEEPHPQTYAILITEQQQRMLPTILSRCQILSFKPLSTQYFIEKQIAMGIKSEKAPLIAELTNNLDEASELSNNEWFAQAQKIVVKLYEVLMKSSLEALVFLQEEWYPHFKEKEQIDRGLDLLLLIYKDLLYIQIGKQEQTVYVSEAPKIGQYAFKISGRRLAAQMTTILEAKRKLQANMNTQLLMEELVLSLQEGSSNV